MLSPSLAPTAGTLEDFLQDWQANGATLSCSDQLLGPFAKPLVRIGNDRNAFARLKARVPSRVRAGEQIRFGLVITRPTVLVSALGLVSEVGRPELRIHWSSTPPRQRLIGRSARLCAIRGEVVALNDETFTAMLVAENRTYQALDVTPVFHVAHGIENVGLDAGMHIGVIGIEPSTTDQAPLDADEHRAAMAI